MSTSKRLGKYSQVWTTDFAIGLVIFSLVLISYYTFTTNISKQDTANIEDLIFDSKSIASSLMSMGNPIGWKSNNVTSIGITDGKGNINKSNFLEFTKLGYNSTKRIFGTNKEYFLFFTNSSGDLQNVEGFCGTGNPLVNSSFNLSAAYMYEKPGEEEFLKAFMENTFDADIYCSKEQSCQGTSLDEFISNINNYQFIVVEHPSFSSSDFNDFEDAVDPWLNNGGILFLGGQIGSSQQSNGFGVQFKKISGQSESDRLSTTVNEDEFVEFSLGDNIVFRQAYHVVDNGPSNDLKDIVRFNGSWIEFDDIKSNGDIGLARWDYGSGKILFFSDFDADYLSGDITEILQNSAKTWADAECDSLDISKISTDNLIKVERIVLYRGELLNMILYLWD
jgi:glutaredoxin-related protein